MVVSAGTAGGQVRRDGYRSAGSGEETGIGDLPARPEQPAVATQRTAPAVDHRMARLPRARCGVGAGSFMRKAAFPSVSHSALTDCARRAERGRPVWTPTDP